MIRNGDKVYVLTVFDVEPKGSYVTVYNNREDAVRSMLHDMGEQLVNGRISDTSNVRLENRINVCGDITYIIDEATYRVL